MFEDLLGHLFVLDKSADSHLTLGLGAVVGINPKYVRKWLQIGKCRSLLALSSNIFFFSKSLMFICSIAFIVCL